MAVFRCQPLLEDSRLILEIFNKRHKKSGVLLMLLVLCLSTSIPASNFWLHLFEGLEEKAVLPYQMGVGVVL
jgi:hypothetical protein